MNSCIIAITPPRHETLTDLAEAEDPILGRHFPLQTGHMLSINIGIMRPNFPLFPNAEFSQWSCP